MKSHQDNEVLSEINITPFVDVMLVLLVIFMITTPILMSGIDLKLPKTKSANKITMGNKFVVISIDASGDLFLGSNKILIEELLSELKKEVKNKDDKLFVRAHSGLPYGKVVETLNFLKENNYKNISLVTEVER